MKDALASAIVFVWAGIKAEFVLIRDWAPMIYRGGLYFIPVFLTPFVDKICPILFDGKWPTAPHMVGCAIIGTVGGAVVLRSFSDGSIQRHGATLDAKKQSGDTQHFVATARP